MCWLPKKIKTCWNIKLKILWIICYNIVPNHLKKLDMYIYNFFKASCNILSYNNGSQIFSAYCTVFLSASNHHNHKQSSWTCGLLSVSRNTLWEPVWQLVFYSLRHLHQTKVADKSLHEKEGLKNFYFYSKMFLCSSIKCVYFETKYNWLNWCIICQMFPNNKIN